MESVSQIVCSKLPSADIIGRFSGDDFDVFWKEEGFACYWCVPLTVKGEVKGVLDVYRRTASA
ncbi:MAG: GAF domain-containing protein, partial [Methylococcaceae bacterium]